ncbi:hypothetical protein AC578_2421 [Pseudocercospora eumusae]|uniref:Uncharacterized protein n=1 Tax=Pseudocercospora eumusae TaxID=321146 RepID=A0A139HXQ1_9PEZI|nr:hypothetical protein AC578_2421 [Pseudocercospora eumusae]
MTAQTSSVKSLVNSAEQTAHAGVRDKLGIKTEVGAVSLNLLADQRTELTAGESLLLIDLSNHLLVRCDKLVTWNPGVVSSHHRCPSLLALNTDVLTKRERTLVLVGVLELSSRVHANDTTLGTLDLVDLVHSLLVILGDNLVGTVHSLTVLTSLETPLNVLRWGQVEVVINVSESMLLDICDTDVLVLVDVTLGWDQLTSKDVDERRLSGTVRTNDSNTGAKRALEVDVADLWLWSTWVLEFHVADTDNGLGLGLDTFKETWLWELEFHLGGAELVVRLGRWHTLDELAELATVALQLEALVVDNVLNDVVEEFAVVGNDDGCARRVDQVVFEPLDVLHVQMVGWLVKQKDIWLLENCTRKGELHLPTTRKSSDDTVDLGLNEAELEKSLADLVISEIETSLLELHRGPRHGGKLRVSSVQIVLDVDGLDFALLGEALDLLVVDGTHERSLSGTVGTEQTVSLATLEAQMCRVEQNLSTVGQVECTVAKILALLLVRLNLVLGGCQWRGTLTESADNTLGVSVANNGNDVWLELSDPGNVLALLLVDELTGDGGDEFEDGRVLLGGILVLVAEDVLELRDDRGNVAGVGDFWNLAILDIADTDKSVKTLLGLLTGFRISQVVVVLGELWHQLWQESGNNVGVLDKLAHVVDDDGGFTLDGGLALLETTLEQRHHDGEGWLVDVSDEGGSTEQVNSLWDVLWLGDTLDELRNEALDILVDDKLAHLLHGGVCALLDLRLGVPHGLGDDGDEVWHLVCSLCWGALAEGLDALEIGHLFGPLLCVVDGVDEVWDQELDGVGVDGLGDGKGGVLGSDLDGGHLVTDGGQDVGEELDEVWLDGGRDVGMLRNGGDGLAGELACVGILLVVEHLLQALDGLGGRGVLLDVAIDKGGDVLRRGLGLVGGLGKGQFGEEILEHFRALGVLLLNLLVGHGEQFRGDIKGKEGSWFVGEREKQWAFQNL